jgi:tetratricopeptide (TPR) repeat protein
MKTSLISLGRRNPTVAGFVILVCLALLNQSSAFAASPSQTQQPNIANEIVALYSAGNDAKAMTLVESALARAPKSPELHYLKANILVAEDRLGPAISEYQEALNLHPDPALSQYCTMELNVLTHVKSQQPRASATIAAQASEAAQVLQQQSMNDAQHIAAETATYKVKHEDKTARKTNYMASAGSYDKDGDWVPAFSPTDIANMQAARAAREQQRIDIYNRSSADIQNAAHEKAMAAASSAEGLESVLQAPVAPGESALNPANSNLYIRNYTTTNSSPPAPGAKGSFKIGVGPNE